MSALFTFVVSRVVVVVERNEADVRAPTARRHRHDIDQVRDFGCLAMLGEARLRAQALD